MDRIRYCVASLALLLTISMNASAQIAGQVDPTFNPGLLDIVYPSGGSANTRVRRVLVQPDGKVLIAGIFKAVHKSWANYVARLNPDGTVDTTFRAPELTPQPNPPIVAAVYSMALQPDGKVLIGGNFASVGGQERLGIARLNSDGSLDTSFVSSGTSNLQGIVQDIEVGSDGKITFTGDFTYAVAPNQKSDFARVSSDGSLDSTYYPQSIITAQTQISEILLLGDGKMLVAVGASGSPGVTMYRLNAAAAPELMLGTNGTIARFAVQSDGKTLVGGSFTSFNGFSFPARVVRLNTNDAIDTSFTPPTMTTPGSVDDIEILPNGKILLTGGMTLGSSKNLVLLNPDGTADSSFAYTGNTMLTSDSAVQLDGRIVVGAFANNLGGGFNPPLARLASDGSLEPVQLLVGNNGRVNDLLIQQNAKILAGGVFNFTDGAPRMNLSRLDPNGAYDPGFLATIFTTEVLGLNITSNGTILTSASGGFAKLNPSGSSIYATGGISYSSAPLPDGRILVGLNNFLIRLNTNNSFDPAFNVQTDLSLRKILVQPDGKILIAGFFTSVNGVPRGRIARLNSDGTLDTSFAPPGGANYIIFDIALQNDGKILIAGPFNGVNFDTNYKYLARLNTDGSLDTGFHPVAYADATSMRLQPDGKILLGCIDLINGVPRPTVKRFNSDGSVDPTFDLGSGADGVIRSIELFPGNKIVIGGDFRSVNGVDRLGIARLTNNLPTRAPFDYDGDGKSDISVVRASENKWYILRSSDFQVEQVAFGIADDVPTPGDYDGDGKTDVGIFRPSNGQWWYRSSINGSLLVNFHGGGGDIPRPSDVDGDGKTDLVYFRPSNNVWFRRSSVINGSLSNLTFGAAGDQPLVGDFDGDGRSDPAVFRPSTGDWWYAASGSNDAFIQVHWGQSGDIPVPADFDGDGKTDNAIFRPSDGGWYIYNSSNGSFTIMQFGTNGDRPVAADYDGDGRADVAVFRPSTGIWYLFRSTAGFAGLQFGIATDLPTPNAFNP